MYTSLGFLPPAASARVPPEVLPLEELSFASHLAPWTGEVVDVNGKWLPATILNASEVRPTYLLAREREAAWRAPMRELILARLAAAEARALAAMPQTTRKPLIAIEETPTSHGADRVMDLLPSSRALQLIRDPRDVVDSLMRVSGPSGLKVSQPDVSCESEAERLAGAEWAAKHWAMSLEVSQAALAAHDPELTRTVRYEDLFAEPERELAGLLAWLGLDRDAEEVAEAVAANAFDRMPEDQRAAEARGPATGPGRWRENLSAAELDVVARIIGERGVALGYPSV